MHFQTLENELNHLEKVMPHAGNGPFPLSYWQARLASLPVSGKVVAYHRRVERLKNFLTSVENAGALTNA